MDKIANMNFHYHRYPFDYFLDSTVRLGLNAIELWAGAPHLYVEDTTHQEVAALLKEIRRRDLELVCFTPEQCIYPINLAAKNDTLRRRSLDYFQKSLEVANSLECGMLLVTAGYGFFNEPAEEAWRRARESLEELCRHAEAAGVILVLEPLSRFGSNVITNLASLKRMISEVGSPQMKALLDTVPMTLVGDTIDGYAAALGRDLAHVHFLDGDGKTSAHLAWGEGCFPLEAFKRSLDNNGYDGFLSLEIIGPQYNWDPENATRASLERLRHN
ncbi:sugar phosphate isomerase/epimerase family protein [Paenibacillus senegalensis]|uniref:sugar phosphate isomerase/epimerase family protein n=1 Tax=Paenibacillus senegalensis TaxID=1465766 RepID=UPI000289E024|nr:sugar phosphate isomerase/epimerase family protein [Paenibacillus senegalensis]